jgi:hypothetical protein
VSLAPRDRLAELGSIDRRLSGKGPTLYPDFEEFAKHFLRHAEPEGPSEAFQPGHRSGVLRRPMSTFGHSVDLDQLRLSYVEGFPAIVTLRSPVASRPPFDYRRTFLGRHYEVWERARGGRRAIRHLPLDGGERPAARCGSLARLAAGAGRASLAGATVPPVAVFRPGLDSRSLPGAWARSGDSVAVVGAGKLRGEVRIPATGRYRAWLEGSFGRRTTVRVGGRQVGSVANQLDYPAQYLPLGTVSLRAGPQPVGIERGKANLRPGNGDRNRRVGPLVLVRLRPHRAVAQLPLRRWRVLCGRRLDWAELLRS